MKNNGPFNVLDDVAKDYIPENTNLAPRLAARLERKSLVSTLRTRPVLAMLIALFILLTLSGVAYALGKALGYIPGVGIVDQSTPLRVLAEPVSQTRDGITVTVTDAVLSADRTIVVVKFENVPVDKLPNQKDNSDCYPNPALQLPQGDPLQPSGSQGNDWGAGSEYHYTYAAVPAEMNDATLFIGCVPGDVNPRTLPENWELPLRFVAAPADMTALPVIEYAPTPAATGDADSNQITLTKVIDLGDIPLVGDALAEVLKAYPRLDRARLVHETVRRIISGMVGDLLSETGRRARKHAPRSSDAVRALKEPLVSFSAQMRENNRVLQGFLSQRMYRHERVLAITDRARRVIRDLFQAYMNDPALMPKDWREDSFTDDQSRFARQVCDFIAGMTDRFAGREHERLTGLRLLG